MSARDAIRAAIEALKPVWVDPPVLQPAALYLELAGEALRRRAFLVADQDGADERCLRPDMTVPAVRAAFAADQTPARVAYEGKVFRRQSGGRVDIEFSQIGVEWLGADPPSPEADAEIIAVAVEAARAAGVEPRLVLGDVALRAAFVDACGLAESWRARVLHALERREGLAALFAPGAAAQADGGARLAAHLARLPVDEAEAVLEDVFALADIVAVGERPMSEIVERLRDRGSLAEAAPPSAAQRALLQKLVETRAPDGLTIAAALAKAPALAHPARAAAALDAAEARMAALARRIKLPAETLFAPGLGRAVAYYDGFVFELEPPGGAIAALGGGGRYDGLARRLWPAGRAAPAALRAAGFALTPTRFGGAS